MTATEWRGVGALAGIFALRMLGLFMVLPVFALYARTLDGATPLLVGLALGIYGLTQAIFQIPFGLWSDRYGRKPVIVVGLVVFAVGSLVAGFADSVFGIMTGRALQGAGAIASAVLALTADLTRPEQRTKAMAVIGICIGAMFIAALMLGPVVESWLGVPGMFFLAAGFAGVAVAILRWGVPTPTASVQRATASAASLIQVLADRRLLGYDLGIFVLHAVMTAVFVVVPGLIEDLTDWPGAQHWRIYVPVLLLSMLGMVPLVLIHSRAGQSAVARTVAVSILAFSQVVLAVASDSIAVAVAGLWLFFVGFNTLEAMLPSEVSQAAPDDRRGAALGVYNTFQFAGVFFGGVVAGGLHGALGVGAVFVFCAVLIGLWGVLAVRRVFGRVADPASGRVTREPT